MTGAEQIPDTSGARRRAIIVGAVLAALIAVGIGAALVLGGSDDPAAKRPNASAPAATLELSTDFQEEAGPDGQTWQWIGDSGGLTARGSGVYWLTMQARSLRRPRFLFVNDKSGRRVSTEIGRRPGPAVIGPIRVNSSPTSLGLEPLPTSARASAADPRFVSIFLSNPRLSPSPIAVLPTRGFYRSEFDARKRPFNWLRDEGILEVFTPKLDITRVWLRFDARSVDADRPVIISGGGVSERVVAPGGDRSGELSAGPFALRDGRLRITVRSETPPRRFGADPRPLSVRFARLWASPSAPPPPGR